MSEQHTPGPWLRRDEEIHNGVSYICELRAVGPKGDEVDLAEEEANARLICAAPDILAALERWVEMMEEDHAEELAVDPVFNKSHQGDGAEGCTYCEALAQSRAALAKARGEVVPRPEDHPDFDDRDPYAELAQ